MTGGDVKLNGLLGFELESSLVYDKWQSAGHSKGEILRNVMWF